MLIAISHCRGVVHKKFFPQSRTINLDVYKGPLQLLHGSIRRHRPEYSASWKWLLVHDNARRHVALSVKDFLSVHQIAVLPHKPYSPDVTLPFFLIPTTERGIEGSSVCFHSGHPDGSHRTALQHSRKCFPGLLPRLPEKLEAVY